MTISRGTVKGGWHHARRLEEPADDCCAHRARLHRGEWLHPGNAATLAGHVIIEDFVTVGAFSPVHQFCTVGNRVYRWRDDCDAGCAAVFKDFGAARKQGFRREQHWVGAAGFSVERIKALQKAFRLLLVSS